MDNKMTAEQALGALVRACEIEFTSLATEIGPNRCEDSEAVSAGIDGDGAITFGMIRAAREALAALSAPRVPDGWIIRRGKDGAIVVQKHGLGGYAAREMGESGIAESILYHLAEAMLAASPEPVAQPGIPAENIMRDLDAALDRIMTGDDENGDVTFIRSAFKAWSESAANERDLRAEVATLRARTPIPVDRYAVVSDDEDMIEVDGVEILDALSMLAIAEEEEPNKAWSIVATIDAARLREGGA